MTIFDKLALIGHYPDPTPIVAPEPLVTADIVPAEVLADFNAAVATAIAEQEAVLEALWGYLDMKL